jgi:hypothetical protein
MKPAISLAGLTAVLLMAYGFERWSLLLRQRGADTLTLTPFLWLASIANLLLAVALLLLAWFVTNRANRSRFVSLIFIVVGLLITFATAITFSATSRLLPLGIMEYLTPNSRVVYAAAIIAATGIAGLILQGNVIKT